MKNIQNRARSFSPTLNANCVGKKVYKRSAYKLAYFLLPFAYMPAFYPAYLQATGSAENCMNTAFRLTLWLEEIVCYSTSCWLFQNRYEDNHNG